MTLFRDKFQHNAGDGKGGSGRFGDWTPRNTTERPKQAIVNDRWDREDLEKMLESIPPFDTSRRRLAGFTDTGNEAMADLFWSFLKAEPEAENPKKMSPKFRVNHSVINEARELDEYQQLKRFTENDDVQAALACIASEQDIQTLFDRLNKQLDKAQELEDAENRTNIAQQNLNNIICGLPGGNVEGEGEGEGGTGEGIGEWLPGGDGGELTDEQIDAMVAALNPEPQDGETDEEAQARAAAAQQTADELAKARQEVADALAEERELEDEFEDSLDKGAATIRNQLRAGLGKAADEAQQAQEQADAWGMGRGELQRLPAHERMELARRLNNPRFRRIADLFGPMRNVMFAEQQRKTVHAKDEVHDIGMGKDLARMLPQELLHLAENEDDFLRRFSEGGLLQYELQGTERLARGGIIFCEDGSGSMHGDRELWSKAVMLCLLHLARQQKRPMHVIHFGGYGEYKVISFVNPEDFALERILDTAELFFGGGTDFQTPMGVALDILRKEHLSNGAVKGDVVFCTDDECGVPSKFMGEYLSEAERMQFTTFGISVSGHPISDYGPLHEMSQGKVLTIKDFASGEEIRDVFRAL